MGKQIRFHSILSISLTVTLTACAPVGKAEKVAVQSLASVGCKVSQSEMWSSLQGIADDGDEFPSEHQLRAAVHEVGAQHGLSGAKFERYAAAFIKNYNVTIEGIKQGFAPSGSGAWKKALAEMEVGVRVTEVHAKLQEQIQNSLNELDAAEKDLEVACTQPEPRSAGPALPGSIWEQLKNSQNPEVSGIRKTFATAYQSCDVLSLPVMTAATPSAQGITITGNHPAGGKVRAITNLALLNSTHYYIHNQRLAKNTCFEVRKSPMIYDFGGKPYTNASAPSTLDMFRQGGSGSAVLGIDCSAFVFSSLALAGLKMDPDPKKVLKADLVNGIGSGAFKEPQSNGLRCLDKITVSKTKSIAPGDIVAINGHVNMIDSVGTDPFGLARAATLADCTTSKLTISGFNFVIAQSSPSKGGIGINRVQARDYLNESSTFKTGLQAYAVAACKAKFGGSSTVNSANLSVVRHRRTPECSAPALVSKNQECVDSCKPL